MNALLRPPFEVRMSTNVSGSDAQASEPVLLVISGPLAHRRLVINRSALLFGSHPACDYKFPDSDVAEMHCLLVKTDQGYLLRDCRTQSGTLVNGVAVAETLLKNNDTIQIGSLQLRASLPDASGQVQPHDGSQKENAKLSRRRAHLAQLAWKRRTRCLLLSRQLSSLQERAKELENQLLRAAQPQSNDDVAQDLSKQRQEILDRRNRLEDWRKELDKREAELNALQQHIMEQAARGGRREGRQNSPAELAHARKELERLKINITRLASEEATLLENISTFRKLEEEQRTSLDAVQKALARQSARLLPDAIKEEQQLDYLRQLRIKESAEFEHVKNMIAAGRMELQKQQDHMTALEDELNRLRNEREQEEEAYKREREIQSAAFNARRQEMHDLAEQKKAFIAERARQLDELAKKDEELARKQAQLLEMEAGLNRQRIAVQQETESWYEQRQALLDEHTEREKEIEQLRDTLKQLRNEETKIEMSIAEWNSHAEGERKALEKELAERRANVEAEMEATKRQYMGDWLDKRDDIEEGLRQFRGQAEQAWEEFLTRLRSEAREVLDLLPKHPAGEPRPMNPQPSNNGGSA